MAHIGMKNPVAAKWAEGNKYTEGFVVAKAINFTGTPNKNEAELFADDGVAETDKSVKDWGTSLGVDDLSLENQAKLLGHTYVKAAAGDSGQEGTPESIEIGTEDEAPYFGVGFYKQKMLRQKVTLQTSRRLPLKVKRTLWRLMARCQSVKSLFLTLKQKQKLG